MFISPLWLAVPVKSAKINNPKLFSLNSSTLKTKLRPKKLSLKLGSVYTSKETADSFFWLAAPHKDKIEWGNESHKKEAWTFSL